MFFFFSNRLGCVGSLLVPMAPVAGWKSFFRLSLVNSVALTWPHRNPRRSPLTTRKIGYRIKYTEVPIPA
jgi:hypothetical protein